MYPTYNYNINPANPFVNNAQAMPFAPSPYGLNIGQPQASCQLMANIAQQLPAYIAAVQSAAEQTIALQQATQQAIQQALLSAPSALGVANPFLSFMGQSAPLAPHDTARIQALQNAAAQVAEQSRQAAQQAMGLAQQVVQQAQQNLFQQNTLTNGTAVNPFAALAQLQQQIPHAAPWQAQPQPFGLQQAIAPFSPAQFAQPQSSEMALLASAEHMLARTPDNVNAAPFYTPPVDIAEHDETFEITADMPGVNEKSVEVYYNNGLLTIRGRAQHDTPEQDSQFHRRERRPGIFQRIVPLNAEIEEANIKAVSRNGVLEITLPKAKQGTQTKTGKSRVVVKAV